MLTKQHLPILGDTVIVVPPKGPYVQLPHVEPNKRVFPKENKTITPQFNQMRPNGYASSESILDVGYKETNYVNRWFIPDIDWRHHPPSTLH